MAVNCQDCDHGSAGSGFQYGGVGWAGCPDGATFNHGYHEMDSCAHCFAYAQGACNSATLEMADSVTGGSTPVRPKPTLTGQPAKFRRASGFKRARRGGTGQAVTWRKQSGESEGGLFGLSTAQLLIAGAVGVGAYLILKKRKK